ncbi:MAG: hypothetical protein WD270_04405 [Acetobacterales bacterium]
MPEGDDARDGPAMNPMMFRMLGLGAIALIAALILIFTVSY